MEWIKRNLFFVCNCLLALCLIAVAVVFLLGSLNRASQLQEEWDAKLAESNRIYQGTYPNKENILKAQEEQKKMAGFRNELAADFPPYAEVKKIDDQSFKSALESMIAALSEEAGKANVMIPPKYSFTFAEQRSKFQFSPGSVEAWMRQLEDIHAICRVLYSGKINVLDSIQRTPVMEADAPDILNATPYTNQMGISFAPYRIGFRSFSAEIAFVLDGFARSTNGGFIVKSVEVSPASVPLFAASSGGGGQMDTAQFQRSAKRTFVPSVSSQNRRSDGAGEMAGFATTGEIPLVSARRPVVSGMPRGGANISAAQTILLEVPLQVIVNLEVVRISTSQ